ncbi:MAG: DNA polymerase III subunit beta [Candidatus Cloacimonetes bacterium]|nr:DNA polymerase III subunit beta [Candidatus Cloacimonadota bacterium]
MKFTAEKHDLVSKVLHLSNMVPAKNTMPMLMNFLIEADEDTNRIRFTATDLEITIVVEAEVGVSEGGKAAVNAKHFTDIVNSLPEGIIRFEKVDEMFKVSTKSDHFDLLCADPEQYPLIPQVDMADAITIDAANFAHMIENTHFAVSSETNRPIFTGVFWKLSPEGQLMVATDGKKIAEFKLNKPCEIAEPIERIVPTKGLQFLRKVITEGNPTLKVMLDTNRVMFNYGQYTIFSHVLEGRFPDYRKAMPENNTNHLKVSRQILLQAVKKASLMASDETFKVKLEVDDKKLAVSAANREAGDALIEIEDFAFEGEPTRIAFNYRFLSTILSVIETDRALLTMGNSQGPALLFNDGLEADYEARFLLMPLRIV